MKKVGPHPTLLARHGLGLWHERPRLAQERVWAEGICMGPATVQGVSSQLPGLLCHFLGTPCPSGPQSAVASTGPVMQAEAGR